MNDNYLIDECQCAKVVYTRDGAGIMIAGNVIEVRGPTSDLGAPIDWVSIIVAALRRAERAEVKSK